MPVSPRSGERLPASGIRMPAPAHSGKRLPANCLRRPTSSLDGVQLHPVAVSHLEELRLATSTSEYHASPSDASGARHFFFQM